MNLLALDNEKLSSIVLFFVAFFAGDEVAAVQDDLLADGDGSNDKWGAFLTGDVDPAKKVREMDVREQGDFLTGDGDPS